MLSFPIPGYSLYRGSTLDRAWLLKFMQLTYQELYPDQSFGHLARTIDQYFSRDTPLWWVQLSATSDPTRSDPTLPQTIRDPIAGLWLGNSIDQVTGDRHAHIFLLYVMAEHRHQGIGSALMLHAETWATQRGDRQIGLQVFQANQPALNLYTKLGYAPLSLWMVKPLNL